jgi:hypothetical protein
MDIPKSEHVRKPILSPLFVPAATFECLRIFERSKENVPKRDIREIVCVMSKLMMHAMRFRSLKDEAKPSGSFYIPMIEKFSHGNEDSVIAGGSHAAAE